MSANMAYVHVLGAPGLAATQTPAADVAERLVGETGAPAVSLLIVISTFGFLNLSLLSAPRVYYAMAADGLFFRSLARLSPRFQAPTAAILLQGGLAAVFALTNTYDRLLGYAVFADWIFFALAGVALIVFRRKLPDAPRPYPTPGYPWMPLLFILAGAGIVLNIFSLTPATRSWRHRDLRSLGVPVYFVLAGPEERMKRSVYMRWAKEHAAARYNLANSGLLACGTGDLASGAGGRAGERPEPGRLSAPPGGDRGAVRRGPGAGRAGGGDLGRELPRLRRAAWSRATRCWWSSPPTSRSWPLLAFLGARIRRFARRFEDGWRIDLDDLRKADVGRVRLVVVTNPHNPSGRAAARAEEMAEVARIAERAGALVLVDEVYRDIWFEEAPPSHVHLGPHVLATNSLTKSYGLSGLRCGWVLARAGAGRPHAPGPRLHGGGGLHAERRAGARGLPAAPDAWRRGRRAILDPNIQLIRDVSAPSTPTGSTASSRRGRMMVFPRLRKEEDSEPLHDRLRALETSIVPGRFFENPRHFRLGLRGAPRGRGGGAPAPFRRIAAGVARG